MLIYVATWFIALESIVLALFLNWNISLLTLCYVWEALAFPVDGIIKQIFKA